LKQQLNISNKSLVNRVEQIQNRISGIEDKLEELDQTVKGHEKVLI
jgi:hypothetical protein